jgi:peptidoglycan/xylan/chitin deacetylase (PgdA/CDA1 family)
MFGAGTRISRFYKRKSASVLFRKRLAIQIEQPLISFTFDDFPRTALLAGGAILKQFELRATYYTALGLLGKDSPSGPIAVADDLRRAVEEGNELGCHTFAHCHSWDTGTDVFVDSVARNREAMSDLIPGAKFKSFSYPISEPRPSTKRAISREFLCCRAGGQTMNAGTADLNQLFAYFLEKADGNLQPVKDLIDKNKERRGWIIFATHDVAPQPSRFGCTPDFFEAVVQYALSSGARVLPVAQALAVIRTRGLAGESVSGNHHD